MKETEVLLKLDEANYSAPTVISAGGVSHAAARIHNQVLEGQTSAIQVAELFKFTQEIYEKLKETTDENGKNRFMDLVRDEIENNSHDGKTCTSRYGTMFSLIEAGVKYDFRVCNDAVWNTLQVQLEEIKAKIKEREKFLKGITEPIGITDLETGETREVLPPTRTSTSSYKQELLKD